MAADWVGDWAEKWGCSMAARWADATAGVMVASMVDWMVAKRAGQSEPPQVVRTAA